MIARTIQSILAPVVMITACAILLTGLLGHYAAINARLRAMSRERIDLLRNSGHPLVESIRALDEFSRERLDQIDTQLPTLLQRHKLIHDAVQSLYAAILVFLISMLVIALAVVSDVAWLSSMAVICFVFGMLTLFVGVVITLREVRISHQAIEFEARRVLQLGH
jgi:Flp pilus assembly protein TadB